MYKDLETSVAVATALLFTLFVFIISTDRLGAQEQRVQIGVAVTAGSSSTLVNEVETPIGRNVNVVRRYQLWDDEFPSANDVDLLNGRDMILSVRARQDGEPILWADIASAQPGDPLYQDMVEWANAIRPYESQIWLSFHHEPESRANMSNGEADDFIAAWRNFMTVIDSEGVELAGRVWIMTGFAFQQPDTDRNHPDRWYPGDEWVEAIGADVFNWHECRTGINNAWSTPRSIIEPIRDFGINHPTEQMMIAELGSVEDPTDPTRKGEWITDAQSLFKNPSYSQFTLVSYFNLHHDEGIADCDWRISTSTAATDAFAALAADPFYGGTGIATPFVLPPPDTCTAVRDGATVTLDWNFDGHIIRRNGNWLTTEPDGTTTFTDINAPANATYIIRDFQAGIPVDTSCEFSIPTPEPPANVCTAVRTATSTVTLDWNVDGRIIRRNGDWLTTEPNGTTTFTDTSAPANATYLIRDFNTGSRRDTFCEFATPTPEPEGEFVPDPNKVYHIDNPAHGLRLAARSGSEVLESASLNSTGDDTRWRFVQSATDGLWHIRRAAGGSTPGIRTVLTTTPDMQATSSSGTWTRFSIEANANIPGTYLLTVPLANTVNQRLRLLSNGNTDFATNNNTGINPSFVFTEAN